jgi:hypothetical protein
MKASYIIFKMFYFRVSEMLDYTADDLTGRSMYSLCHASDIDKIRQTHTDRKYPALCPLVNFLAVVFFCQRLQIKINTDSAPNHMQEATFV